MPPQPKRNRCVILYDLNCRNQRQLRRALLKIYSYYYFRNSKDYVNLVLVNCEKTLNRKHNQYGKGYTNILEAHHEEVSYDPRIIHESIEAKIADTSSWKEALAVAVQILKEDKTPRIITYQILYLTDLSCSRESDENIDDIISVLNQNNIFLNIVGPTVTYPKTITNFEEVKFLFEDISFENENKSLIEAKYVVKNCNNAVIADVIMGLQFFFNYKNPIGKQVWTVPITVGSKIKYSVGTSKLFGRYNGFTLKCKTEAFNPPILVSAVDSTKKYDEANVRKGILKHGKFIPLANNDMFKVKVDRMLSLVFITKLKNIPEYMMKGPGCYTVKALKKTSPAAFHSLLFKLDNLESCLIVKRIYAKGCSPVYMALLPVMSKKCFRAVQLPYGSEVPFEWLEEDLPKNKEEVTEEVVDFLNDITVGSKNFSLNCKMTPNVINSSRGEALVNLATERLLLEPNLHLEQVDFNPFSTGIDEGIGKKLREMWPSRGPATAGEEEEVKDKESDDDDVDYF